MFPAAAASIVHQAFILMERTPPASTGDGTPEADDAALLYPEALASVLEASDWSFASRLIHLSEIALPSIMAADPDLPHLYELPTDLLRLREAGDRTTAWRIDGGYLRSDMPGPLRLRYTMRIIDEQQATAGFRMAVAAALAVRLAPRWLGTSAKVDYLARLAEDRLARAARDDRATGSAATWHGGAAEDWGRSIWR